MKGIKELKGCGTAIVTPFLSDGSLDEKSLKRLVDFQIKGGVQFLVPCGTTGENPTLTRQEHLHVVDLVLKQAKGQVPVIAGVGGYNTAEVIEMAKKVEQLGVQGILSVTPYYNKPTQEGLIRHYTAIAESVAVPIILYNVPGRTGVNLLPDTVVQLSSIPNIVGIKEASGSIAQIGELAVKLQSEFKILSGDDPLTLPMMAMGAVGVISVVSNQAPHLVVELTKYCLDGDFQKAMKVHARLADLMRLDFIETNPIPVKAGLAMMGLIEENYRLPLVPMSAANKEKLRACMDVLGLIAQ